MLYFVLNFSTRPPRFTNFCCPVKNGWHAEHTSSLSSGLVDLVTNSFPHAQVTLHSTYSGWIPSFMLLPLSCSGCPVHIYLRISDVATITPLSFAAQPLYHGLSCKSSLFYRFWEAAGGKVASRARSARRGRGHSARARRGAARCGD